MNHLLHYHHQQNFEECYLPPVVDVKEEETIEEGERSEEVTKKKRGRTKRFNKING